MTELLHWLLGLEQISLDTSGRVELRWQLPAAGWLVALVCAGLVFYVVAVYRRDGGRRGGRIVLAGLRCALVLLVVAAICQPILVLERTKVDPSFVAVLVDASASMARADRYYDAQEARAAAAAAGLAVPPADAPPPAELIEQLAAGPSRYELFLRAAAADDGAWLTALAENNRVRLFTFASRAAPVAQNTAGMLAALRAVPPTGAATDLAGAVQDVLRMTRGTRLAGIIVASDGVSTVSRDLRAAGQAAQRRHVPVHTVLLGSSVAPRDVSVGPLFVEDTVFVKDLVAITARVSARGYPEPIKLAVTLRQEGRAAALATETVTVGGRTSQRSVEFRTKPERGGKHRYVVSIEPRPDEVDPDNNRAVADVTVIDDKIRVLYVDYEPRYEYRYLKNTLLREETVVSSCLLLAADESFVQEGDEPITRFPESPEELFRYDVVLFGDVPLDDDWLTDAQEKMLVEFVGRRGGGFGVIAGERYAPHTFRGSPLELLLPVRLDPENVGGAPVTLVSAYHPELTHDGRQSPIFRFELDAAESLDTFEQLEGFYWLARTLGAKPGATVLATHPTVETLTGPAPVIVTGRYGAGRTFFQATDDTWRWREYTGESYFDSYWLAVIRYLTRSKTIGRDRRFELVADPPRAEFGQPVTVRLTVLDPSLTGRVADRQQVRVVDDGGVPVTTVTLSRLGPEQPVFEGTFVGPRRGGYVLSVRPAALDPGEKEPTATVTVESASLESRVLAADHDALRQLAAMTEGGQAVRLDGLGLLPGLIEDRSVAIPDDIAEPLWDTHLVLVLFVLIIMTEWVVRKAMDLV